MNILVCMKQVPDTQKVKMDPVRNTLIRKGVPSITNPFDESALELALEIRQRKGGGITVLTMGIPASECILRDALSLGADRAYLLTSGDFAGADTWATSYTLSCAIKKLGSFDLMLFGKQAIDGDTAQVGPEVAGHLGFPVITFVTAITEVTSGDITVERMIDNGKEIVQADLPVVLTVVKAEKRLRMPNLEEIVNSFDRTVERMGAGDIDADVNNCGLKGSPTRVKKVFSPKPSSDTTFIEGSIEEKAKGFVEVIRAKGIAG